MDCNEYHGSHGRFIVDVPDIIKHGSKVGAIQVSRKQSILDYTGIGLLAGAPHPMYPDYDVLATRLRIKLKRPQAIIVR